MALIENESPTIETGFKPVSITLEDIEKWQYDEITFEEQLDKCENGICKFDERDKLIEDLNYSINMEEAILNSGENIGKLTVHLSLRNLHLKASKIGIELESINLENETDFKTVLEESKEKKVSLVTKVINVIKKLIRNAMANISKLLLKFQMVITNNGKKADALLSKLDKKTDKFTAFTDKEAEKMRDVIGAPVINHLALKELTRIKKVFSIPSIKQFEAPVDRAKEDRNLFPLLSKGIKDDEALTFKGGIKFLHFGGVKDLTAIPYVNSKLIKAKDNNDSVGIFISAISNSILTYGFLMVKDNRINIDYNVMKALGNGNVAFVKKTPLVPLKKEMIEALNGVKTSYKAIKENSTESDKLFKKIDKMLDNLGETKDEDLTHNINVTAKYLARLTVDEIKTIYGLDRSILYFCNQAINKYD